MFWLRNKKIFFFGMHLMFTSGVLDYRPYLLHAKHRGLGKGWGKGVHSKIKEEIRI